MKRKVLFWSLGILAGVLLVGAGVYAYNVYSNVSQPLEKIHQPLKREVPSQREEEVKLEKKDPMSILVMGVDKQGGDQGRSDTLMLLTLNPKTNSMKIVGIPRDTYTEIVGKGKKDKINHAYAFGGIDMTVNTVEKFLNVPVDHYVEINMEGFKEIVDAVGGLDVNNDLDFTDEGVHFAKGNIHLNGTEALVYVRMRKLDPRGDFGRQMRQRQVMQAVMKKGTDPSSLGNYTRILSALEKNVKTSFTQKDIIEIPQNYRGCQSNIEEIQIEGKGTRINRIYYEVVDEAVRQNISKKLREHLELPAQ
ncbi:LytR family transcriptional regulator [Ectobacillus panaciterrae]|uniref:polyisoprenyl-teichoic acid--peptidoglycan teichoic acid transferase TagU n=1 Tax=Ectobacillus panaciterrae TaxID=363872 RepID=UPI000492189F|nr:LytR family transcriptional regulator [Ectobacillus panaciterrae]